MLSHRSICSQIMKDINKVLQQQNIRRLGTSVSCIGLHIGLLHIVIDGLSFRSVFFARYSLKSCIIHCPSLSNPFQKLRSLEDWKMSFPTTSTLFQLGKVIPNL